MRTSDKEKFLSEALRVIALLMLGLFVMGNGAETLQAQGSIANASLSGAVYDKSDAPIPGAKVTLLNSTEGFSRTFTTTPDGRYSFASLPPGAYTLTVEKSGFGRYQQKGIILNIAQAATQDVSLQVGAITQTVTVTAGAALLDTTTANIGTEVTDRQLT